MNLNIENFEQLKLQQQSSNNITAAQNDILDIKKRNETANKSSSIKNTYNYQKALHKIMSGENTMNFPSTKKVVQKDNLLNFSQLMRNQQQANESPANSILAQNLLLRHQSSAARRDDQSNFRNPSLIQFEYMPRKDYETYGHNKVTINQNDQRVVFVNFKMKEFPKDTLNLAINRLIFGTKATLCIPSRKSSNKVILVMSTTSADKLKAINPQKQVEKVIDITKICDIEYGIKNQNHANIRGLDSNRVLSFIANEKEEFECLVQFDTQQDRELFFQGFQHFVKQSHKTQLISGNIFKLRQQIEIHIEEENGKEEQRYDINEILDIFDSKVQICISRSYLRKLYISVIRKDIDQQLTQQKISYVQYQKILTDQSGLLLQPITNQQFLLLIDMMLDRSELYSMFEKAAQITDIRNKDKSENMLTLEGFKSFVLYHQKEIITMSEIEQIFEKILQYEKKNYQIISPSQADNLDNDEEQKYDNELEKKDAISFHGFVRYIYSKNNSIFNPKKEPQYQNMNKPINEYFVNSAKNIFHANFDIITMSKIAGFNFDKNEKYFPLLYVLSRGARYVEIEVWQSLNIIFYCNQDGDTEPVIIYGPIMNTKLNISEFLNQLIKQAFVINPFPLFLNIVPHCNVKQQFKLKHLVEKILKDNIYILPPDYKERTNLPSPNDLKYKIILVGKLPHTYDGLIQEHYTQQDVVRLQQQNSTQQTSNLPLQPNPNTTTTQDYILTQGGTNHLMPSGQNPNNSFNQPALQNILSTIYPQQSMIHQHSNISGTSQLQLIGQVSNQNRSASVWPNMIDGTLLTPVHVFSEINLPGDSLDQEMNELILQEDIEENVNVIVAAGYVSKDREQLESNLLLSPSHRNSNTTENIQSTTRRGNPSSVKAIDHFFSKNLDAPKFKKFIQHKYEDNYLPDSELSKIGIIMERANEEQSNNNEQKQKDITDARRGTFLNMKYHPQEIYNHSVNTNQNGNSSNPTILKQIGNQGQHTNLFNQKSNISNLDETNQNTLLYPPSAPRQKQESLNIINYLAPTYSNGMYASNFNIATTVFQMHCVRDYAPILASNTIESLYSMYVSKIVRKKPAMWEIYDFSQREINQFIENRLGYSVLSSYSSLESFTKYYLSMIKPNCKPSDSVNINPLPYFLSGFTFILSYFHTFDRNSLIYQSRFYENGGQTCGYILKPFHLRNHVISALNKNKQKTIATDNNFFTQIHFNSKIDELDEDDEENEEVRLVSSYKSKRHFVQMQVISGYNLSTVSSDKVDSYVEILVLDGEQCQNFKTTCIENNNMNPKWNYDMKFTVQNPSLCFIVFQVVNSHHTSLLGWYSIPFNCIRQGVRVVPLKDGFFNTLKNSFILCEISVVRESQGT